MKRWMGWTASAGALLWIGVLSGADVPEQVVWNFDRLDRIGGHSTEVVGHPRIVDTPAGKAIEFNGVDDGLYVNVHPLAGAATYTWEAIFCPDGGDAEQRWFHLEQNPATGLNNQTRMLFEIRVIGNQWCLDAYNRSGRADMTLLDTQKLHPLGAWYQVAQVYDGKEYSCYVDGVKEGGGAVHFTPQGEGRTSVGMRMQKVYFFKGAVAKARFTRRALQVSEFLKAPAR